jgi:hypothetical protein
MERKKLAHGTRFNKRSLDLDDIFEFEGISFKISHISEVGVRAEEIDQRAKDKELRTLYWFGVEHFESETGHKIKTRGGFPVPMQPGRYVVSPEGFGEILKVKKDDVNVRLFNLEGQRGRRKAATFTRDQLRSLSQHHPQLSNAGSYIKGVEKITVSYSEDIETQATVEVVRDIQDGRWRHGIEFQLPTTRGGIYSPSKFYSRKFDDRRKALIAGIRDLKVVMREEMQRADTSQDQRRKIIKAIKETDAWLHQQIFKPSRER